VVVRAFTGLGLALVWADSNPSAKFRLCVGDCLSLHLLLVCIRVAFFLRASEHTRE
jgi:hypothetical protein